MLFRGLEVADHLGTFLSSLDRMGWLKLDTNTTTPPRTCSSRISGSKIREPGRKRGLVEGSRMQEQTWQCETDLLLCWSTRQWGKEIKVCWRCSHLTFHRGCRARKYVVGLANLQRHNVATEQIEMPPRFRFSFFESRVKEHSRPEDLDIQTRVSCEPAAVWKSDQTVVCSKR